MQPIETFTFPGAGGAAIAAYRLLPDGPPRGVVQIAHGMAEHFGRYQRLARGLAGAGFAVYGNDHRGHGRSAGLHGLGEFGPLGFQVLVDDMAALTAVARREVPDRPVVLIGHSMGSFASQLYLLQHHSDLNAIVLSGTAAMDRLMETLLAGGGPVTLELLNAGFEPARTSFDWLSSDEAEVDAYIADPLCGFSISDASMGSMFALGSQARFDVRLGDVPKDFPIYVISGEFDPVVGPRQAFVRTLIASWEAAGLRRIEHRVYPDGRHEMFNETARDGVQADLLAWLREALAV